MENTARKLTNQSRKSRPKTDGNKNVQSRARRKGHGVPDGMIGGPSGGPLAGPDRGTG